MVKVGIVGTGMVGSTTAYALVQQGTASELVLVDHDAKRAEGEAMDLSHAVPFHRPCEVRAGTHADLAGAMVVVITAGTSQVPGQTRLDLVGKNVEVVKELVPKVAKAAPEAILVVASNPVDVLTHAVLKASGLPVGRVIGSGTVLDTARFRALLGAHFEVDPRSVHAYVIGEHGDSEVAVFGSATVAGVGLEAFAQASGRSLGPERRSEIAIEVRDAAYRIIERKRSTYYGIGSGLARLVEAIVRDQGTAFAVSSLLDGQYGERDVCVSLPGVVGAGGLRHHVPLELTPEELAGFRRSAGVVRELTNKSL